MLLNLGFLKLGKCWLKLLLEVTQPNLLLTSGLLTTSLTNQGWKTGCHLLLLPVQSTTTSFHNLCNCPSSNYRPLSDYPLASYTPLMTT